jgi:hypothetical protein
MARCPPQPPGRPTEIVCRVLVTSDGHKLHVEVRTPDGFRLFPGESLTVDVPEEKCTPGTHLLAVPLSYCPDEWEKANP